MTFLELVVALAKKAGIPSNDITDVTTETGESGRVVDWVRDTYEDIQTLQSIKWKFLHNEYERDTRAAQTLDADVAADNGSGLVGIPITGHGFSALDSVTIKGTTNYNGTYAADATTSANELVITATYAAETFTALMTAEVRDYDFYTTDGIQQIDLDSFYYYLKSDGSDQKVKLKYMEYREFKNKYKDFSSAGTPSVITVTPTNFLRLYPFPDAIYTIESDAFSKPQVLAVNGDIPIMPSNFHTMIVWKALIDYAGYEESGGTFQHAAMRFDELYNQLLWQEKHETEEMVVRPV